jgi:hypothetical protein
MWEPLKEAFFGYQKVCMARRVFFSFHYERDLDRVNEVRTCWKGRGREEAGFWDHSLWERTKRTSEEAIKRLIAEGLENTSVTAVLIGNQTYQRPWVRYEIEQSYKKGKGLIGIYIHDIPDRKGHTDTMGNSPFDFVKIDGHGQYLSEILNIPLYNWEWDRGKENIGIWADKVASHRGGIR